MYVYHAANTEHWAGAGSILGQRHTKWTNTEPVQVLLGLRRRQWANIAPTLAERLVLARTQQILLYSTSVGLMLVQQRNSPADTDVDPMLIYGCKNVKSNVEKLNLLTSIMQWSIYK